MRLMFLDPLEEHLLYDYLENREHNILHQEEEEEDMLVLILALQEQEDIMYLSDNLGR